MPTPQFSLPGGNDPAAMRDYIIKLQRDLQYLLTNLDDLNISRLNARVIIAESITSDKIAAKSITAAQIASETITAAEIASNTITAQQIAANTITATEIASETITAAEIASNTITAAQIASETITAAEIATNTITADRMNVSQLSAITANLGTVTAGSITSNTVISVGTDAYVGRHLYLNVSDSSGTKGVVFHDDGSAVARIDVTSGDISINSSGFVLLNGSAGAFANGGKIAIEGISVGVSLLDADGVTPRSLTFTGGTLRNIA